MFLSWENVVAMWLRQRRDDRGSNVLPQLKRGAKRDLGAGTSQQESGWRIFVIENPIFNIESHGQ